MTSQASFVLKNGYASIKVPNHPRAQKGRDGETVRRSVLVVEERLGKYLPLTAIVHHVDGNKLNDAPSNLVVCQDRQYHEVIERRTVALRECGHATWRKCWICKRWDVPEKLRVKDKRACEHPECALYLRRLRYPDRSPLKTHTREVT